MRPSSKPSSHSRGIPLGGPSVLMSNTRTSVCLRGPPSSTYGSPRFASAAAWAFSTSTADELAAGGFAGAAACIESIVLLVFTCWEFDDLA